MRLKMNFISCVFAQSTLKFRIVAIHDDVIKWKHFPHYWPWSPANSPHKGQWREALVFSLIWAWIYGWVSKLDAGDLRRHRNHYHVILMRNASQAILCRLATLTNLWFYLIHTRTSEERHHTFLNVSGSRSQFCLYNVNCYYLIIWIPLPIALLLFRHARFEICILNNQIKYLPCALGLESHW